jgi:hypothetical protein
MEAKISSILSAMKNDVSFFCIRHQIRGASSGLSKILFVEAMMYSTPKWGEIVDNPAVIG